MDKDSTGHDLARPAASLMTSAVVSPSPSHPAVICCAEVTAAGTGGRGRFATEPAGELLARESRPRPGEAERTEMGGGWGQAEARGETRAAEQMGG